MILGFLDFINSDIYFSNFNKLPHSVIFVFLGIIILLGIIARLLLFKKANKNPIHALIPFYGIYEYYSIFWKGIYGIIIFLLSNLFYILLPKDVNLLMAGPIGYFCLLIYLTKSAISLTAMIKLAKSFEKNLAFAYGLFFLESIFVIIIGLDKSEYLGPTLREYNNDRLIDKKSIKDHKHKHSNKAYMINLYKWRSIVALIAAVATLFLAIFALGRNLIQYAIVSNVSDMFMYFTTNSNVLITFAAACIIPFALEGIRKKRFSYPKWIANLHYAGTICTTLTMVFAIFIISRYDSYLAFGKYNLFLHIICPIGILISFMFVESGYKISIDESVACLLPFVLYAMVYTLEVFLIGENNGGWADAYMLVTFAPIGFSITMMFMLALGVSLAIRFVYNKLTDFRKAQLQKRWPKDASAVEIKIEAYGLGRYMGTHEDVNNASLPLDILSDMAEHYDLKQEELIRAYTKGVIDGSKERDLYFKYRRSDLGLVFGTPYRLSDACLKK